MATFKDRAPYMVSLIKACLQVVRDHRVIDTVPLAVTYFNLLQETGRPGIPLLPPTGASFAYEIGEPLFPHAYKETSPRPLCLIPITPEDERLGPGWQELCRQPGIALYESATHAVLFNITIPETPRGQAVTLLHELAHAHRAVQEGRAGKLVHRGLTDAKLAEEVAVHLFEETLWHALGGPLYISAIEYTTRLVLEVLKNDPTPRLQKLTLSTSWVDDVLGPVDSKGIKNARALIMSIHAHLRALERFFDPALPHQIEFMRLVYQTIGYHG